jgi:4-diphosphocytidyl-2-C-methyl-D-erythritol kinase
MATRQATVRAFAKLNLSLLVLGKRADGYHELRTIFQSISLADRIQISWTPGARWTVEAEPEIDNNLAVRAAELLRDEAGMRGRLHIAIQKAIPMGGGLGGGSSNAAALLLALPVLAGAAIPENILAGLATAIGSDVPYFLHGGTMLAFGRGEEMYPLTTPHQRLGVVVTPGMPISTPEAFRALGRPALSGLTFTELSNRISNLRVMVHALNVSPNSDWRGYSENDFEAVVFERHPQLAAIRERLTAAGAAPARMSGSGSTLFGVFESEAARRRGLQALTGEKARSVRLVTSDEYRSAWLRALGEHKVGNAWPPRSRYAKSK